MKESSENPLSVCAGGDAECRPLSSCADDGLDVLVICAPSWGELPIRLAIPARWSRELELDNAEKSMELKLSLLPAGKYTLDQSLPVNALDEDSAPSSINEVKLLKSFTFAIDGDALAAGEESDDAGLFCDAGVADLSRRRDSSSSV